MKATALILALLALLAGLSLAPVASAAGPTDCFQTTPAQFPSCVTRSTGAIAARQLGYVLAYPGCILNTPPVHWFSCRIA